MDMWISIDSAQGMGHICKMIMLTKCSQMDPMGGLYLQGMNAKESVSEQSHKEMRLIVLGKTTVADTTTSSM